MLRLLLTLSWCLCCAAQVKLALSAEDMIVPGEAGEGEAATEFESAKLDFVRRRRRKMLTSTVSPSLKGDPKEPRITVKMFRISKQISGYFTLIQWFCWQMKPSTEILKRARERDLLKNRIRHKSPHLKEFQHRKRRFKPQNPRFRNPPRTASTPPPELPEQPGLPDNLTPDTFPKLDTRQSRVSSGEATQVQSPLGRDQDSFETTNMGRNRVVLLQEPEAEEAPVSFETELPPLYLASTTSRSLGEDEGGFVLRSSEEGHTLAPSLELQSGELDSRQHELEPSLNDLELQGQAHSLPTEDSNSVIKLGVSIEEVESAARGVVGIGSGPAAAAAAAAASVTEVKAAADTGEGAALYRFEYKLLGPGEARDSAGQGSLLSLHTQVVPQKVASEGL